MVEYLNLKIETLRSVGLAVKAIVAQSQKTIQKDTAPARSIAWSKEQ